MVLQQLGQSFLRILKTARSAPLVLMLGLIISLPVRADSSALIRATIGMDRQYIPALIYTGQGDQASAEKAMMRFTAQWSDFVSTFAVNSEDPQWQHFLDLASGMVSEAFVDVKEGEMTAAYQRLEAVGVTLRGMRERNGIDYYLDDLNHYKRYMETMIRTAEAREGLFSMAQIRTLQKNWAQVWPRWQEIRHHVSKARFDQELYGFSDDRFVALKQAVAQEQLALNRLRQALRTGTHKEIADAAIGLEAGFMRTYRAFGDMPYE